MDCPTMSTEHPLDGNDCNPSDTLDTPEAPDAHVGEQTGKSPAKPGTADVVDEKGRPLEGDGTTAGRSFGDARPPACRQVADSRRERVDPNNLICTRMPGSGRPLMITALSA